MGMIEDVMKALERIPLWKRVSALPEKVSDLEKRISELEARLAGKAGHLCPMCNAPGFAVKSSKADPTFGDLGLMLDTHQCPSCGHTEDRKRDTMK